MGRLDEGATALEMFAATARAQAGVEDAKPARPAKAGGAKKEAPKKEAPKKEAPKKESSDAKVAPVADGLDSKEVERRFKLIHSVGEECVTEADLQQLLSKKAEFRLYDGFEPSGRMHIAQGIFKALNVNKCTSAGGTFVFWVADWFALMNDKMGGDLEKIKVVGQYFIEVWKGAGMDLGKVEFRWASDDIINNAEPYWNQMLDISKRFTITRIKKCCQIMGRLENTLTAAQVLYPLMQCTDIFFLKADICQLGVDQRKVNMLAREYCDAIGRKLKPVILSHHMLYGLAEGQAKMSKSNPDSAIFMEDPVSEVERKMNKAYCPRTPSANAAPSNGAESLSLVQDDLKNPCLDYVQHIVMSQPGAVFKADCREFPTFEEVREAFLGGSLSEEALKKGLAVSINAIMQPVRDHFANDPHAKQVLELVRQYKREEAKPPSRLKRSTLLGAPGGRVAVIAPCPTSPALSLGTVLSLRSALQHAVQLAAGAEVVLYLPDLSAVALDCFGGDKKLKATDCVTAAFDVLEASLRSLGALEGIKLVRQSSNMVADPSDYWVSVINVGRRFQLQEVHEAVGLEEGRVGAIVAALMHVGDVLALAPKTLVTPAGPDGVGALHRLAASYISMCADQEDSFPAPEVVETPAISTVTSANGAATTVDLLVTDNYKAEVKKKFKQAFCEPGNAQFSPVLHLAEHLAFARGASLQITTAAGDKTYSSASELAADIVAPAPGAAEGEFLVHPSALKQAVDPIVESTYAALAAGLKAADKSVKAVANYIKRNTGKKGSE